MLWRCVSITGSSCGCVAHSPGSRTRCPPQAELPSLTDTYARDALVSEYSPNLPPYMWLGLRSYGDGKVKTASKERTHLRRKGRV